MFLDEFFFFAIWMKVNLTDHDLHVRPSAGSGTSPRQCLNFVPNFQCQTLQHLTRCRVLCENLWEEHCRVECPPTPTVEMDVAAR